jgi:4-aminobutyrate aminotransferase/(S)-3-amino-2-methylpropionate transaminase
MNVGHRAPSIVRAVEQQLGRYLHTCFSVAPYEPYVALCERLNAIAPGRFPKKTFLVNSGAEAVENAIKIARHYTRRPAVICFEDAFHGRTALALSLTSKVNPYKAGFAPFAPDVYRIPYPARYRCTGGESNRTVDVIASLEDAFRRVVPADGVAAVIAEPVLGEGGFLTPAKHVWADVASVCRKHGIVFIADEVQTGIARTGTMFAVEQYGVEPDLLITAKSLGGGLPIASVTGRADIMDSAGVGGLGGTFGGNPLACEAALAVLDFVEREDLCGRARELEQRFLSRAAGWQQRWREVAAIHGLGAMRSIEITHPERNEAAPELVKAISKYCYEHGVLTISAGTYGNIIRLLMPLVITESELSEALDILETALSHACEGARAHQVAMSGKATDV